MKLYGLTNSFFRAVLVVCCLSTTYLLYAQNESDIDLSVLKKRNVTLEGCIQFALRNSPKKLDIEHQLENIKLDNRDARLAFTPSLNANISESASFGRSQDKTGVFNDVSSANTSFQIGASLSIFEGGAKWYQLKKAELSNNLSSYIIEEVDDNIALQVINNYLQVLLAKEIHQVAVEKLELTNKNLKEVQQKVDAGKLAYSKLLEIEAQKGRDELSVDETAADIKKAFKLLLIEMGAEHLDSIDIEKPDINALLDKVEMKDYFKINPNWKTPTIKLAIGEVQKSEYDVKRAQSGWWPSISLSGGYSNGYYYNFGEHMKAYNQPFADQIKANGRTYVGLSLNIPIFTKGQVSSSVRRATINRERLKNELRKKEIELTKNREIAKIDLEKAKGQKELAHKNVDLAKESFKYATIEYENGRLGSYEWEFAKNKVAESQATYIRSAYDYVLKTITLKYFNTGIIDFTLAQNSYSY